MPRRFSAYDPITQTKRCKGCGLRKPVSEFRVKDKIGKYPDRWAPRCGICTSVVNAVYYRQRTEGKLKRRRNTPPIKNGLKVCPSCDRSLPIVAFGRSHRRKDGCAPYCKDCTRVMNRRSYENNGDTVRARTLSYSKTAQGRASSRARRARRRAQKRQNSNGTFTPADWLTLLSRSPRCHWCKRPWTKRRRPTHDHVIPLARGGKNTLENSCCACATCNARKNDRLINPLTNQGILL